MSNIRAQGLSKKYGGVVAVNGIDLTVGSGEFVTLLGPSGSGKTTTLRMVAGLEQPDGGTLEIGGNVVHGPGVSVPAHKRGLGMVFQSYAVWPHKTVYENVAFPLRMQRVARGDEHARVERMLDMVGLDYAEYGARFPAQLSGGQQQRVALARALVADPQVILYDEPLSNLDARLRDSMRVLLRSIHDKVGVTALYVTHDQLEAMVLSDRVCVMNQGVIVQQGVPRDLYDRPSDLFVAEFVGQANVLAILETGPATIRIGAGIVLQVPAANRYGVASARQKLVIRHHQVRLLGADEDGGGDNVFAASVKGVMYLGDRIRYTLELGANCEVIAEVVADGESPAKGVRVRVRLPGASCMVI